MIVSPTAKDKNEEEGAGSDTNKRTADASGSSSGSSSGSQATAQVSLHSN